MASGWVEGWAYNRTPPDIGICDLLAGWSLSKEDGVPLLDMGSSSGFFGYSLFEVRSYRITIPFV